MVYDIDNFEDVLTLVKQTLSKAVLDGKILDLAIVEEYNRLVKETK